MKKEETSYKKLSQKSKRSIAGNALEYNKNNYKQIAIRVKPEVHAKFLELCKESGLSQPAMLENLINNCDLDHK